MKNLLLHKSTLAFALGLLIVPGALAQAPTFEISAVFDFGGGLFSTQEANVAVNTTQPEILVTTEDPNNVDLHIDPIAGVESFGVILGQFFDPETLEPRGEPFIVLGSPDDQSFDTHEVDYNPVTNQYVVAGSAQAYPPQAKQLPVISLVDAGTGNIAKSFPYNPDTPSEFDDVSVAVNTSDGSFAIACERDYPGAGDTEGAMVALFDKDGNALTETFARIDTLEPDRDEDDPDIAYLPNANAYIVITNIDPSDSANLISGTIVQPVPDANGNIVLGPQTVVSELRKEVSAGHADAIENPWNSEVITAFNYDSGTQGGDLTYYAVGSDGSLTVARDQSFYIDAEGNFPVGHRHPQLAVDPVSGTIIVSHSATGGGIVTGMVFSLLGPEGEMLPGRENDTDPYTAAETAAEVSSGANNHDVAYDPFTQSYFITWTAGGLTQSVRVKVTSRHGPADVGDWMMF